MGSGRRSAQDLWGRIRGPWHRGLTTLMVLVAATVAILEVLLLVTMWQFAGNEVASYGSQDGLVVTRMSLMAQMLTYLPFGVGSPGVLGGAVAAAAAFALAAHRPDSDAAGAWRRVSWAAAFIAVATGMLAVLLRFFVHSYALIAMDESVQEVFGLADALVGPGRVLGAGADGLLWIGALVLGLVWRADAWSLASEEELEPDDELEGAGSEEDTDPSHDEVTSPAVPPVAYDRPAVPEPPTGPRLEPDGSSDSGYDEFRFRR